MSINFPLEIPTVPAARAITMRMQNIAGMNVSPFTGQQQNYEFQGEWWEADVSLPPISSRDVAEQWIAFLAKLRGQTGTFVLGDPLGRSAMGSALGSPMIPRAGLISSARSKTLVLGGFQASEQSVLLPGDYLEIGRNLLTYPTVLDNAIWTKVSPDPTVTANATTAPDGSATADQIAFASTSAGQKSTLKQTVTPPILGKGQWFIFGVWLRAGSALTITIEIQRNGGTVLGTLSVPVGTTWGYYTVEGELDADGTSVAVLLYNPESQSAKTVFAWGASLDDGISRHRLHKALTTVDADANGFATVDVFPRLREAPDEAAPIYKQDARGMFRLASNTREWTVDIARLYGIGFKAMEAF